MAWFRIDDRFHHHPKVLAAGNAATGLWVRCGCWSADYLTDGAIPLEQVREMGRPREVDALITARLWVPTDDAMLMPDYLEYNPSAGEIKDRRRRDADRKRAERAGGAAAVDHDPITGRFIPRSR